MAALKPKPSNTPTAIGVAFICFPSLKSAGHGHPDNIARNPQPAMNSLDEIPLPFGRAAFGPSVKVVIQQYM
jgi:hypothetical protein